MSVIDIRKYKEFIHSILRRDAEGIFGVDKTILRGLTPSALNIHIDYDTDDSGGHTALGSVELVLRDSNFLGNANVRVRCEVFSGAPSSGNPRAFGVHLHLVRGDCDALSLFNAFSMSGSLATLDGTLQAPSDVDIDWLFDEEQCLSKRASRVSIGLDIVNSCTFVTLSLEFGRPLAEQSYATKFVNFSLREPWPSFWLREIYITIGRRNTITGDIWHANGQVVYGRHNHGPQWSGSVSLAHRAHLWAFCLALRAERRDEAAAGDQSILFPSELRQCLPSLSFERFTLCFARSLTETIVWLRLRLGVAISFRSGTQLRRLAENLRNVLGKVIPSGEVNYDVCAQLKVTDVSLEPAVDFSLICELKLADSQSIVGLFKGGNNPGALLSADVRFRCDGLGDVGTSLQRLTFRKGDTSVISSLSSETSIPAPDWVDSGKLGDAAKSSVLVHAHYSTGFVLTAQLLREFMAASNDYMELSFERIELSYGNVNSLEEAVLVFAQMDMKPHELVVHNVEDATTKDNVVKEEDVRKSAELRFLATAKLLVKQKFHNRAPFELLGTAELTDNSLSIYLVHTFDVAALDDRMMPVDTRKGRTLSHRSSERRCIDLIRVEGSLTATTEMSFRGELKATVHLSPSFVCRLCRLKDSGEKIKAADDNAMLSALCKAAIGGAEYKLVLGASFSAPKNCYCDPFFFVDDKSTLRKFLPTIRVREFSVLINIGSGGFALLGEFQRSNRRSSSTTVQPETFDHDAAFNEAMELRTQTFVKKDVSRVCIAFNPSVPAPPPFGQLLGLGLDVSVYELSLVELFSYVPVVCYVTKDRNNLVCFVLHAIFGVRGLHLCMPQIVGEEMDAVQSVSQVYTKSEEWTIGSALARVGKHVMSGKPLVRLAVDKMWAFGISDRALLFGQHIEALVMIDSDAKALRVVLAGALCCNLLDPVIRGDFRLLISAMASMHFSSSEFVFELDAHVALLFMARAEVNVGIRLRRSKPAFWVRLQLRVFFFTLEVFLVMFSDGETRSIEFYFALGVDCDLLSDEWRPWTPCLSTEERKRRELESAAKNALDEDRSKLRDGRKRAEERANEARMVVHDGVTGFFECAKNALKLAWSEVKSWWRSFCDWLKSLPPLAGFSIKGRFEWKKDGDERRLAYIEVRVKFFILACKVNRVWHYDVPDKGTDIEEPRIQDNLMKDMVEATAKEMVLQSTMTDELVRQRRQLLQEAPSMSPEEFEALQKPYEDMLKNEDCKQLVKSVIDYCRAVNDLCAKSHCEEGDELDQLSDGDLEELLKRLVDELCEDLFTYETKCRYLALECRYSKDRGGNAVKRRVQHDFVERGGKWEPTDAEKDRFKKELLKDAKQLYASLDRDHRVCVELVNGGDRQDCLVAHQCVVCRSTTDGDSAHYHGRMNDGKEVFFHKECLEEGCIVEVERKREEKRRREEEKKKRDEEKRRKEAERAEKAQDGEERESDDESAEVESTGGGTKEGYMEGGSNGTTGPTVYLDVHSGALRCALHALGRRISSLQLFAGNFTNREQKGEFNNLNTTPRSATPPPTEEAPAEVSSSHAAQSEGAHNPLPLNDSSEQPLSDSSLSDAISGLLPLCDVLKNPDNVEDVPFVRRCGCDLEFDAKHGEYRRICEREVGKACSDRPLDSIDKRLYYAELLQSAIKGRDGGAASQRCERYWAWSHATLRDYSKPWPSSQPRYDTKFQAAWSRLSSLLGDLMTVLVGRTSTAAVDSLVFSCVKADARLQLRSVSKMLQAVETYVKRLLGESEEEGGIYEWLMNAGLGDGVDFTEGIEFSDHIDRQAPSDQLLLHNAGTRALWYHQWATHGLTTYRQAAHDDDDDDDLGENNSVGPLVLVIGSGLSPALKAAVLVLARSAYSVGRRCVFIASVEDVAGNARVLDTVDSSELYTFLLVLISRSIRSRTRAYCDIVLSRVQDWINDDVSTRSNADVLVADHSLVKWDMSVVSSNPMAPARTFGVTDHDDSGIELSEVFHHHYIVNLK